MTDSENNRLYHELGGIGSDIKTLFRKLEEMSSKADAHRALVDLHRGITDKRLQSLEDVHKGAKLLGKVGLFLLPTVGGFIGATLTALKMKLFG